MNKLFIAFVVCLASIIGIAVACTNGPDTNDAVLTMQIYNNIYSGSQQYDANHCYYDVFPSAYTQAARNAAKVTLYSWIGTGFTSLTITELCATSGVATGKYIWYVCPNN